MEVLYHIRRFFEYLLFRIYRHGLNVMGIGRENWLFGGYFYFLVILSIIPGIIFLKILNNNFNLNYNTGDNSLLNKFKGMIFILFPIMLVLSILIRHSYLKKLEYTKEESRLYRNVFLVFFLPLVFYILYVIVKVFFQNR